MQRKGQPASSTSAVLARRALNLPISTRPRSKLLASGVRASVNLHPCMYMYIYMYMQGSKLRSRTKLPRWPQTTKSKSPD